MTELTSLGIETSTLDVQSDSSIVACVSQLPSLDILVINAGATYTMPVADLSIPEAKKLFDLNVWSYLAVTQAFLPLLLQSKGMIVNQTSGASVVTVPISVRIQRLESCNGHVFRHATAGAGTLRHHGCRCEGRDRQIQHYKNS